jgi:hypothetical protein
MTTVHALVRGRRHVINTDDVSDRAGAGGEAVVKIINGEAAKIYFTYDPDRAERLRDAPKNAPTGAIMPLDPVYDANDPTKVIGFVMPLVTNAKPISMFGDADFQDQHGLTWRKLVQIILRLIDLVVKLHEAKIILGDFNEKNVLVNPRTLEVVIVDMDNAEWGKWKTRTYTLEFTAPELLVASTVPNDPPVMKDDACYSEETDWYAVAVMVCKVLLGGTPYRDGVHQPNAGEARMFLNRRVLNRISFFGSNVKLPPEVHHPSSLPAGLGLFLYDVFVKDRRETPFPRQFIETYAWMTCPRCGCQHGRTQCPKCGAHGVSTPTAPYYKPGEKPVNGYTHGSIFLAAAPHKGAVQYVHYANGAYRREDDSIVLKKDRSPHISALVAGQRTVLIAGRKFAIIDGKRPTRKMYYATQRVLGQITVAANSRHVYWISGDHLVRDDSLRGITSIGRAIPHMTSVWTGEQFGVALMQAGTLTSVMTFNDSGYTGRYDIHDLSPQPSAVVAAQCVISESHAWLTVTTEDGTTKPYVFNATAQVLATAPTQRGIKTGINCMESSALAVGDKIMVPTSGKGIVRFRVWQGTIQQDGTIPYAATPKDIVQLTLSSTGLMQVTHTQLQPILSIS